MLRVSSRAGCRPARAVLHVGDCDLPVVRGHAGVGSQPGATPGAIDPGPGRIAVDPDGLLTCDGLSMAAVSGRAWMPQRSARRKSPSAAMRPATGSSAAAQPASTISARSRCVTGNHSSAGGVTWWRSRRASGLAGFRYFHPPNVPPLPVTSGKAGVRAARAGAALTSRRPLRIRSARVAARRGLHVPRRVAPTRHGPLNGRASSPVAPGSTARPRRYWY